MMSSKGITFDTNNGPVQPKKTKSPQGGDRTSTTNLHSTTQGVGMSRRDARCQGQWHTITVNVINIPREGGRMIVTQEQRSICTCWLCEDHFYLTGCPILRPTMHAKKKPFTTAESKARIGDENGFIPTPQTPRVRTPSAELKLKRRRKERGSDRRYHRQWLLSQRD